MHVKLYVKLNYMLNWGAAIVLLNFELRKQSVLMSENFPGRKYIRKKMKVE